MDECTLCSLLSLTCRFVYNIVLSALEYRIVIFLLSLLIAVIIMLHVHTVKIICDSATSRGHTGLGAVASIALAGSSTMSHFDYGAERGPHTWQCSNTNQSPINIIDKDVQRQPIRELLMWNHYDELPSGITMENNGHTVVIRAAFSGNTPTLSGADLLASYTFVELCFRWSLWNNEGSEHMLNNRRFPLELQAMHRTGPEADRTSSFVVLILAYFYDISASNPYLDPIVQHLPRIQRTGSKIEIPPFPLSYLCHQFRTGFYSYAGSLTAPPCYQGAEWFIFPEPLAIGERQLNEFRQILSGDGKTRIARNARPVQHINDARVVNLNQYNPQSI